MSFISPPRNSPCAGNECSWSRAGIPAAIVTRGPTSHALYLTTRRCAPTNRKHGCPRAAHRRDVTELLYPGSVAASADPGVRAGLIGGVQGAGARHIRCRRKSLRRGRNWAAASGNGERDPGLFRHWSNKRSGRSDQWTTRTPRSIALGFRNLEHNIMRALIHSS